MKLILASLLLLASFTYAEKSYVIKEEGVSIHVIEFEKDENSGFAILDGEKKKNFVTDHYSPKDDILIVNGGYFDGNLGVVGYCMIDGKRILNVKNPKLSGFLTITQDGRLDLHWKQLPEKEYRDVIQAGPFIVDPGGKKGIYNRSGTAAKRTVIGITTDEKVFVMTTSEVYLYDLSKILRTELPSIDRALNLDGGPSVGLIYGETSMKNTNPVRNFLIKRREVNQPEVATP
ncbi:hypothetical protein DDZ13_15085 [Coraliomargarita sinensis]|uniref:Phosphodiester glycosidase domain-containing protein n=1 Tax=Coraliomargarita sinensis TaxID=2174842 RepID=A0A317ZCW6_9BACT|nr:phosphodiester glycosidase family protein [Coraliomargarita sinensis]PXA02830.1 hypothetical protein DDZ13_15085 [Coraliomargarita sinensis]